MKELILVFAVLLTLFIIGWATDKWVSGFKSNDDDWII
jgi:hypothetical protein